MIRSAFELGVLALATAGLLSCGSEPRPLPIGSHRRLGPDMPEARELIGPGRSPANGEPGETGTRQSPPPAPTGGRFSIDSGFWILNASGARSNEVSGERGEPSTLIADLRVEMKLERQEEREIVEIRFASEDAERASKAQTLVGAIRPDPLDPGRLILTAQGRDSTFEFRIDGTVHSRREVRGTIVGKEIEYAPETGPSKIYGFFSLDRELQ